MLTRLTVVIIMQHVQNNCAAHLKLIKCCMSIIPPFFKKPVVPKSQQGGCVVISESAVRPWPAG